MIKLLNKIINKVSKEKWSVNSDGEVIAKDKDAGPDDCGHKFIACAGTEQHAKYIASLNPSFLSELAEHLNALENRAVAAEAEVQRLNATAQPKCQKCGDTGMADSGGTQPWGEQILIECDCATAQPVSDGWVKCSERMPESDGHYLVFANASTLDGYCDHNDIACYQQGKWSNEFNWLVTHWMPLPAAPGGQDD